DSLATASRAARVTLAPDGTDSSRGATIWVAAERLPQIAAVFPDARSEPALEVPAEYAARRWTREEALVELVRGRLQALGPVESRTIADSLAIDTASIDAALAALTVEGTAMSGSYIPGTSTAQWCDRSLLARIHRYTISRLREDIEPV